MQKRFVVYSSSDVNVNANEEDWSSIGMYSLYDSSESEKTKKSKAENNFKK